MMDPRPDLKQDTKAWDNLLFLALKKDIWVAGVLHGFRCGGLRLHKERSGWVLKPEIDPVRSIWTSHEQYVKDRAQWLVPHTDKIIDLLNSLGGVM